MKGKKKKPAKLPIVQDATPDLNELLNRIKFGMETARDLLEKQAQAMNAPRSIPPELQAILDRCVEIAQRFPDERRAPIVGQVPEISTLAAGIFWAMVHKQNNAALVLAETLYALGYESAKNEVNPTFSNLN